MKKWYEQQLRLVQTVLREPDLIGYDSDEVVRYLVEVGANGLVVNSGGIIDFFRHDLDTANPNRFLGEQDIIAELTEKCHRHGIKLILRVDFRGVERRIYELHPDWFAMDEHGQPVLSDYMGAPLPETLYAPCYLGYYRNEHAFRFAETLLSRYDVDGIWENAPFQHGVCYCRRCREAYRADTGKELPRGGNFLDSTYDEYRAWKGNKLLDHFRAYQRVVKNFGEDKIFCGEIFGLFYANYAESSSDLYVVKDPMDFVVTPLFVANKEPLNAPATLVKFLQALEPNKTPVMLYGHLGTDNQLRYVSSSPAELRIWTWQAVSMGGSLWDCTFNGLHPGVTHDRRNAHLTKEVFGFMKEHEARLHHQRPVASVKVFYSKKTSGKFSDGNRDKDHYITHLIGMEQCLVDRHVQYEFVLDDNLSAEKLRGTDLLIVPNAAILSEQECSVIRAFVADGGRLLATGRTSLHDETGAERGDFGLADVFGCSYTGAAKDASLWGYQYVNARHPITRELEDTELIANWGETLVVSARDEGVLAPLTYVPRIFPQPPERSWLWTLKSGYPTVAVNSFGKGQSVYFASPVDRNVWMHGHKDFSTILGNAIDFLLDGKSAVTTNAPASVHLAFNEVTNEPGAYLLHMINITASPRRPVTAVQPVHNLSVRLAVPRTGLVQAQVLRGEEASIRARLVAGEDGPGFVDVTLDELKDYACVLIRTE